MNCEEHFLKIRQIKSKEVIELYNKTLSTRKVANILKMGRGTIRKILNENGVKIMEKNEAMRIANTKHRKLPFSQDEQEKAYLIGLITGDIHAGKKSKHTLRLSSATTHKAFIDMFESAFDRYGKVFICSTKNRSICQWNLAIDIDLKSFNFLLHKNSALDVIDSNNFVSFLAGFIDTDGSLIIRKVRNNFQYVIKLFNENIILLESIKRKLELLEIGCGMYLYAKKGDTRESWNRRFVYNNDYYCLEIYRKNDVIKLLVELPIKHSEKVRKRTLIFDVEEKNIKHWNEIKYSIEKLRNEIKIETEQTINRAQIEYNRRRNILPLYNSTG